MKLKLKLEPKNKLTEIYDFDFDSTRQVLPLGGSHVPVEKALLLKIDLQRYQIF